MMNYLDVLPIVCVLDSYTAILESNGIDTVIHISISFCSILSLLRQPTLTQGISDVMVASQEVKGKPIISRTVSSEL